MGRKLLSTQPHLRFIRYMWICILLSIYRYMTSSYSQDASDGSSTLSEGSTFLTVQMECSQEQGGCGIKRQNTTSLNAEAVPAHVESSIQELLQAIDRVKTMADYLQAAIAPGMVSGTTKCPFILCPVLFFVCCKVVCNLLCVQKRARHGS